MRLIIISLALLLLTAVSRPTPAYADDAVTKTETTCLPERAEFNTFSVQDGADGNPVRDDGKPYDSNNDSLDQYAGHFTHIFSCKVAGHFVRVNFVSFLSQHMCGAMSQGLISVWVDGVKVVKDEDWGDYDACITQVAGAHPPTHAVTRIIFNARRHLTVCYSDLRYNAKTNDVEVLNTPCQLKDLSNLRPDPTSIYYGNVKLTPMTLDIVRNDSPICASLDTAINSADVDNGLLAAVSDALPDYDNDSDDRRNSGFEQSFRLDVDNDTVPDTLIYHGKGRDFLDGYEHSFSWTSGKTGKTFDIRELWPETEDVGDLDVDNASVFRFVRVTGKIYIYQQDSDLQEMDKDSDEMVGAGFAGPGKTTRHIVELHPDGTVSELCAWAPHPRPEEFL